MIIMQDVSGLAYKCVFGSVVRNATRLSDTSVECNIPEGQKVSIIIYQQKYRLRLFIFCCLASGQYDY